MSLTACSMSIERPFNHCDRMPSASAIDNTASRSGGIALAMAPSRIRCSITLSTDCHARGYRSAKNACAGCSGSLPAAAIDTYSSIRPAARAPARTVSRCGSGPSQPSHNRRLSSSRARSTRVSRSSLDAK
ncbi:hypothetical protein ACFZBU_14085 [Embleya sp. NPDC008237]|uniref:hypothetical protein n=1 Tax=Embleya sp. NPDC008237 TaxID=3363978 RepID=UPI0036EB9843